MYRLYDFDFGEVIKAEWIIEIKVAEAAWQREHDNQCCTQVQKLVGMFWEAI